MDAPSGLDPEDIQAQVKREMDRDINISMVELQQTIGCTMRELVDAMWEMTEKEGAE